jgi:hypothetical protein
MTEFGYDEEGSGDLEGLDDEDSALELEEEEDADDEEQDFADEDLD